MKNLLLGLILISSFHLSAQEGENEITLNNESKGFRPTLFADLGETCPTPDGLAIDKAGNLFLSVPNSSSFEKHGSKILTFDKHNKPVTWYDKLPLHPITKKVHPMGIEFGEDGNLYIADNQNFAGDPEGSRILRVIVENGQPTRAEVLVEGIGFSNGIRLYNGYVYLTDFKFKNGEESGIYCFKLSDLNEGKIVLDDTNRQEYLLGTFPVGIDGIALDNDGNLYAGNYFTGRITKFEFTSNREVKSRDIIVDTDQFTCADGMYYDKTRNSIFLANLPNNSVYQLDLNTKTLNLLWTNDNADGSTGLLDHPCETIVYKNKLIIVNYDTFIGPKNSEIDGYNTLSQIEL